MKKIFNIYLISVLFLSLNVYGRYRYNLQTEYKLIVACIDHNSFGGVTNDLQDNCISRVLGIEKQYSERNIKSLDKRGKLKDLFDNIDASPIKNLSKFITLQK